MTLIHRDRFLQANSSEGAFGRQPRGLRLATLLATVMHLEARAIDDAEGRYLFASRNVARSCFSTSDRLSTHVRGRIPPHSAHSGSSWSAGGRSRSAANPSSTRINACPRCTSGKRSLWRGRCSCQQLRAEDAGLLGPLPPRSESMVGRAEVAIHHARRRRTRMPLGPPSPLCQAGTAILISSSDGRRRSRVSVRADGLLVIAAGGSSPRAGPP
jgi:hypothetical protein